MAIVIRMRSASVLTVTLLAAVLLVGPSATAQAVPVVNEYTEELPNAGGPGKKGNNTPQKNTGNGGNRSTSSGNSGSSGSGGYDDGTSSGVSSGSYDSNAGSGTKGSEGKKNDNRKSEEKSRKKDRKADDDRDRKTGLAAISPSGGDGDGGMGLLFPLAIVVVAGLVGGIFYFRRNKGSLAT